MRKASSIVLAALLLAACEREIPIDYHSAQPLYVTEMTLTAGEVCARITTTQDMDENTATRHFVDDATVTIREEGSEWTDTLTYRGQGRYTLPYIGEAGREFVADVIIDGRHHTSASKMLSEPVITSFEFVWQDMLSEQVLFADLRLQDPPDENNYYFMHIYRNGTGYRWAVMRDTSNPGGELKQLFTCTTRRQMDKDTDSDVLHEGDHLRLEVRSIDQRSYDYLYSLQLMSGSGTNPVANFTGGMLGYFSAYQQAETTLVFHLADIN
ncbi:MAG: DUF4249 family protein [Prevotella sp.]|nr:DUF4249 family protein [Prevotella sp.]